MTLSTNILIELTEDEFVSRYTLLRNELNPWATWSYDAGPGLLFDPVEPDLAFVKRQPKNRVWTLLDGDDCHLYIVSGWHVVNRIGYLISHEPVSEGTTVRVHIPMEASP